MYTVIVLVRVKPEKLRDFVGLVKEHVRQSQFEQHCLSFKVMQNADDRFRFALYETFADKTAYLDHQGTQHFATWRCEIESIQAEPRIHQEFIEL